MPSLAQNASIDGTDKQSTAASYEVYTSVPEEYIAEKYSLTIWAISCTLFVVFILVIATISHFRKVYNSPKGKKRLRKRQEAQAKAKEEKCIANLSRDPTPAADFLRELKKKRKKGTIQWEFKALNKRVIEHNCETASDPANASKNAAADVLPYDHCRVHLDRLPQQPSSDYINASYINSYTKKNAYIATQGPTRHMVDDFWRMVWQENVHCIVMATNLFEHARQQCEKYWHNQHGRYGDIHVWLETSDILADFTIRTFRIQRTPGTEERIIKQFQFACWSDHECPNAGSVLEYRRRVRVFTHNKPGPILVHCGTGDGRTGAFIAVDATLERLNIEKTIDIFNFVEYLRTCRTNMVRNMEQYEFIYESVEMYLHCGVTVINCKELPYVVHNLSVKDPQTRANGFEREFKTLQLVVPKLSVGECAGGHRAENRRKSRDVMIQPPERSRPYLITHDSNDSTDYINAVYVDGYRHGNAYIVTQWPLRSTVNDVWRLIYDYNIPSLVLLNDLPFTRNFPCFWPREMGYEQHFGPLTVEMIEENCTENVNSRLFRIKKTLVSLQAMASNSEDTAKTIRIFQLKCWPSSQKMPSSPSAFIELLTRVEEWQMKHCNGRIPTLVMSKNGVSRCGIYCTISITWDKLKTEGEVDIFRAVRTVKSNRTQLVENMVEYIYCYTFLVVLLDILNTTHPHMIPVNTVQRRETSLPSNSHTGSYHSRAGPSGRHPADQTGDHNNVFLPQQPLPQPEVALHVPEERSPRAERHLLNRSFSDVSSVGSSDRESFYSAVDLAQATYPMGEMLKRPSRKPKISSKGLSRLDVLRPRRRSSPGRSIKIFATENSDRVASYTNLGASYFPPHSMYLPRELVTQQSLASSYAMCASSNDSLPTTLGSTSTTPRIIVNQASSTPGDDDNDDSTDLPEQDWDKLFQAKSGGPIPRPKRPEVLNLHNAKDATTDNNANKTSTATLNGDSCVTKNGAPPKWGSEVVEISETIQL